MLTLLRKRLHKDEEDGFTLIELMVVVLIIAILIAIAIPTFLGAQDRARDRAAQSNLRNGLTAVKTIATDDAGLFTSINLATMQSAEGALSYELAATPSDRGQGGDCHSTSQATRTGSSSCPRVPRARCSPSVPTPVARSCMPRRQPPSGHARSPSGRSSLNTA